VVLGNEPVSARDLLSRTDGRNWDEILTPVLMDSADPPSRGAVAAYLRDMNRLISLLLHEHDLHRLPRYIVHLDPQEVETVDAISFTSTVIGLRAERLVQAEELAAAALLQLERGGLQVAALSARALLEIGAVSYHTHGVLLRGWRPIDGKTDAVLTAASDGRSEVAGHLVLAGLDSFSWSRMVDGHRQPTS
jgi:hypothetical protein